MHISSLPNGSVGGVSFVLFNYFHAQCHYEYSLEIISPIAPHPALLGSTMTYREKRKETEPPSMTRMISEDISGKDCKVRKNVNNSFFILHLLPIGGFMALLGKGLGIIQSSERRS